MHGIKRVIVFCILIVILPATLIIIPLYLRNTVFADVVYPVAESDIIEIRDGISSIFCQQHSLRMNSHFNAFQLRSKPEISTSRKHIRLKKSMTLPDDTLEYWGFYLLKGAKVHLKFCSRYDGSRILVVKGQRDLKTCGLLEHNKNKIGANFAQGHDRVSVFFEDITEISDPVFGHSHNSNNESHQAVSKRTEDTEDEIENHGGEDFTDIEDALPSSVIGSGNITIKSTPPSKSETNTTTSYETTDISKLKLENFNRNSRKKTELTTRSNNIMDHGDMNLQDSFKHDNHSEGKLSNRQRRHHASVRKSQHEAVSKKTYPSLIDDVSFLRNHLKKHDQKKKQVYDQLYKKTSSRRRLKRDHVYDRKYSHGGNAVNFTEGDESNSISSFENGLFDCYNGNILLAEGFPPTAECTSAHFLENGSHRMMSKHEITADGYYYYIFYSDNDLVRNDIHAIFDIYKPTFQYSNLTDSQGCVNSTNCTFPIGFLSDEIVVVEVPTRDGIEHEDDDITYLISTCHPRMHIYAIFPITILILILSCSFL